METPLNDSWDKFFLKKQMRKKTLSNSNIILARFSAVFENIAGIKRFSIFFGHALTYRSNNPLDLKKLLK